MHLHGEESLHRVELVHQELELGEAIAVNVDQVAEPRQPAVQADVRETATSTPPQGPPWHPT